MRRAALHPGLGRAAITLTRAGQAQRSASLLDGIRLDYRHWTAPMDAARIAPLADSATRNARGAKTHCAP